MQGSVSTQGRELHPSTSCMGHSLFEGPRPEDYLLSGLIWTGVPGTRGEFPSVCHLSCFVFTLFPSSTFPLFLTHSQNLSHEPLPEGLYSGLVSGRPPVPARTKIDSSSTTFPGHRLHVGTVPPPLVRRVGPASPSVDSPSCDRWGWRLLLSTLVVEPCRSGGGMPSGDTGNLFLRRRVRIL